MADQEGGDDADVAATRQEGHERCAHDVVVVVVGRREGRAMGMAAWKAAAMHNPNEETPSTPSFGSVRLRYAAVCRRASARS